MANCLVCGNRIRYKCKWINTIYNSFICEECMNTLTQQQKREITNMTDAEILSLFNVDADTRKAFHPTERVEEYLQVDYNLGVVMIENSFFYINDILGYELMEDGKTLSRGGLGAAVAGGLFFGKTGALLGAMVGKRTSQNMCSVLELVVVFKNATEDNVRITFIDKPTSRQSSAYYTAHVVAKECIKLLDKITETTTVDDVKSEQIENQTSQEANPSAMIDEILRLKHLVDTGVITEEEFVFLKKKLLGMP